MDAAWPESTGEALHTSTFLGNPLGCRMALNRSICSKPNRGASGWKIGRSSARKALRTAASGTSKALGLDARPGPHARPRSPRCERPARRGRAGQLVEAMLARGIILLSGGVGQNVLSFTPPFVISEEEIDFALGVLNEKQF
jgi:acetylornithine/succinyldiaminopimelate/putrescine aminotransferase